MGFQYDNRTVRVSGQELLVSGETAGKGKETPAPGKGSFLQLPAVSPAAGFCSSVNGIDAWVGAALPHSLDMNLSDDELTYEVIGGFRRVYNHYGFGLLESAYSAALIHVWRSKGLRVEREVPVPLYFDTTIIGRYRIDIVVEGRLLVEVKACKALKQEHIRQVFHYLKLTDIELALLLNFGSAPDIKRFTLRNSVKRLNNNCISQGKLQEEAGNSQTN